MKYNLIMVGTDAEVFLKDIKTGTPVSAVGLIGGSKDAPIPVPELGNGFMLQEDNVTAEFNVPPASSAEIFSYNIKRMLSYLSFKVGIEQGLDLEIVPCQFFDQKQLQTLGAQTFGCEPDFNAWTRKANELNQSNPLLRSMRTAAAHVHISYSVDGRKPTEESRILLVKALDVFLGLSLMGTEKDQVRRNVYGRAGAFRPKDYGLEYRTLGNSWINSVATTREVFSSVHRAIKYLNAFSSELEHFFNEYSEQIQFAIQNTDYSLAGDIREALPC